VNIRHDTNAREKRALRSLRTPAKDEIHKALLKITVKLRQTHCTGAWFINDYRVGLAIWTVKATSATRECGTEYNASAAVCQSASKTA